MAEHENGHGNNDDWYTPPSIFQALGMTFDLDPCSPGPHHWVPARTVYTKADDGLHKTWHGIVWMNPPFGGRNGVVPWMQRFFEHGNGIGLAAARTSAGWFQDWLPYADAALFPRGKTKFIRPDGSIGTSPGTGVVLFSIGTQGTEALRRCGLGIYVEMKQRIAA